MVLQLEYGRLQPLDPVKEFYKTGSWEGKGLERRGLKVGASSGVSTAEVVHFQVVFLVGIERGN